LSLALSDSLRKVTDIWGGRETKRQAAKKKKSWEAEGKKTLETAYIDVGGKCAKKAQEWTSGRRKSAGMTQSRKGAQVNLLTCTTHSEERPKGVNKSEGNTHEVAQGNWKGIK